MSTTERKSNPCFGFLAVVEHPQHGLFGGYLLINRAGRPLEFHCTAPIRPNRAQQILYGPTLEEFLYGEQIGQALLKKAKNEPLVVCTDHAACLAVREYTPLPVTLVEPAARPAGHVEDEDAERTVATTASEGTIWRIDAAHEQGPPLLHFTWGANRLAVSDRAAEQRQRVLDGLGALDESFDLAEPFTRIREAIEEAQRGAESGQ